MISLSEAARKAIDGLLVVFNKDTKFVIYPFGEGGKILKGILNYEYGIQEYAIIDNFLSRTNDKIKNVTYLKDCTEVVVLISSNRADRFNEIRESLKKYVPLERCVEVYSEVIMGPDYYPELLRLSKIYESPYRLIRIGRKNDGGYIMADDLRGSVAYSFGISDDPSWDLAMAEHGYSVYV